MVFIDDSIMDLGNYTNGGFLYFLGVLVTVEFFVKKFSKMGIAL